MSAGAGGAAGDKRPQKCSALNLSLRFSVLGLGEQNLIPSGPDFGPAIRLFFEDRAQGWFCAGQETYPRTAQSERYESIEGSSEGSHEKG